MGFLGSTTAYFSSSKSKQVEKHLEKVKQVSPTHKPAGRAVTLRHIKDRTALPEFKSVNREPAGIRLTEKRRACVCVLNLVDDKIAIISLRDSESLVLSKQITQAFVQRGQQVFLRATADVHLIHELYDSQKEKSGQDAYIGEMGALFIEIIQEAYDLNASDVHIELDSELHETRVMQRVAGELERQRVLTYSVGVSLTSAAYTRAINRSEDYDIKTPQDGKIVCEVHNKELKKKVSVHIRLATIPVDEGQDAVYRLLNIGNDSKALSLTKLGFTKKQQYIIEDAIASPHGLIVLNGPTGSGKSTTLQSVAQIYVDRNGGRKKLRTLEDPVENKIIGARQTSVISDESSDKSGFAGGVRALMRVDPDAGLIGEMRDRETLKASQSLVNTGHLVLTSVHANDAVATVDRLVDLGMERKLLSAPGFLNLIISQRLVPTLCSHCSQDYLSVTDALELRLQKRLQSVFTIDELNSVVRFRGLGCQHCRGGITGRQAVIEMLVPDSKMLQLIYEDNIIALWTYWRASPALDFDYETPNGLSLMDHAIALVKKGRISPIDLESYVGLIGKQTSIKEAKKHWLEMSKKTWN